MPLTNYLETQKITFKDLQTLLSVGEASAKKYLTEIKTEYDLKIVLFCHFKQYFKISA